MDYRVRSMNRLNAVALTLLLLAASAHAQTDAVAARIDRILREVPLIDGHNDLPYEYEERGRARTDNGKEVTWQMNRHSP